MHHIRSAGRGLGAIALLALVVGSAAWVGDLTPPRPMPPVGVWEYRDSGLVIRLGVWPDYVQWSQDPLRGYAALEVNSAGVPAMKNGWPALRLYEWVPIDFDDPGDTLEATFALGEAYPLRWSPGRDGTLLMLGKSPRQMTRLAPSPKIRRFAIRTYECYGRCSAFKLEVDAQGHVEYEGLGNVRRMGRRSSEGGADLFRILERAASFARPDSIRYWCNGALHSSANEVVIDYEDGRRVAQAAQFWCGTFDLFTLEALRLLPTLALAPTSRPHRFVTDQQEPR